MPRTADARGPYVNGTVLPYPWVPHPQSAARDQDRLSLGMGDLSIWRAECTCGFLVDKYLVKSSALGVSWYCKNMTKRMWNSEVFWNWWLEWLFCHETLKSWPH